MTPKNGTKRQETQTDENVLVGRTSDGKTMILGEATQEPQDFATVTRRSIESLERLKNDAEQEAEALFADATAKNNRVRELNEEICRLRNALAAYTGEGVSKRAPKVDADTADRKTLKALGDFAHDNGVETATAVHLIAEQAGLSESQTRAALGRLENSALAVQRGRRGCWGLPVDEPTAPREDGSAL